MYVTWKGLDLRRRKAEAFRRGAYTALQSDSESVVAFLRGDELLVAAPRLTARLTKPGAMPLGKVWGDAVLAGAPAGTWVNIFTGDEIQTSGGPVKLAEMYARFPVAILERI